MDAPPKDFRLRPLRWLLVRRDGKGDPVIVEQPASMVFHHGNATADADGRLVVHTCCYPDDSILRLLHRWAEDDLGEQIWLKLIGNVAFNTVSTLTGCTLEELGRLPESRELLKTMLEESADVANALGVSLPVSIERRLERGFAVGPHKPSTLQDFEAGKPLEIDCLSGAVVELAERLGLQVPHTRAVHACVQLLDARRQNWAAPSMSRPAAVRS